ncbi:flagellin [Microvirga arabica]|uniref:flagellin n=1 Tax=Microvirga arabica TaxID=1128671 RepID=UPI001939F228|nr:flagellin [Microvirga arabica]MBM1169505.1 flagellin [Microvirga arabica]
MSSINTNLSAMTALQALKSTQNAMNKNQNQISTGLRVGEASHNASYWSISTQMKSDNGALGAVKDSIKQSKAMINTFTSAMDKSLTYLNKMKEGLVAASQPGADLAKIQTEFKANIEGMKSAAGSASFNGQNWLAGAGSQVNLVTSYDGVNNKVGMLAIDTAKTNLFDDAAAGTGGLLEDAAAVDISSATNAVVKGTATAHVVASNGPDGVTGGGDDVTAAAGKVNFTASQSGIQAGTKITWTVGTTTQSYTMTGEEADGTALAAAIQKASQTDPATASTNKLTVAWDATAGLTLTAKAVTEDVTATLVDGTISEALKSIDDAIAKVTEGSAMLGANKALLETQEEFIGVLSDSLTAGVSAFIDADMNEASTRNQALQTQQQLGVQALSMANQNSQMILKLFQ